MSGLSVGTPVPLPHRHGRRTILGRPWRPLLATWRARRRRGVHVAVVELVDLYPPG